MSFVTGKCPVCARAEPMPFHPCRHCLVLMEQAAAESCSHCGMDLAGSDNPCPNCRDVDSVLSGLVTLGPWAGPLREWVSQFKYGGDRRLVRWIADKLTLILKENWPEATVIPVPPRPIKMFQTGFDCVSTIAGELVKRQVPVRHALIRRGRDSQKSKNRQERLEAVALDYRLRRRFSAAGKLVLLDDIVTTGGTMEVCATVLKKAGAGPIYGLAMCRD